MEDLMEDSISDTEHDTSNELVKTNITPNENINECMICSHDIADERNECISVSKITIQNKKCTCIYYIHNSCFNEMVKQCNRKCIFCRTADIREPLKSIHELKEHYSKCDCTYSFHQSCLEYKLSLTRSIVPRNGIINHLKEYCGIKCVKCNNLVRYHSLERYKSIGIKFLNFSSIASCLGGYYKVGFLLFNLSLFIDEDR